MNENEEGVIDGEGIVGCLFMNVSKSIMEEEEEEEKRERREIRREENDIEEVV